MEFIHKIWHQHSNRWVSTPTNTGVVVWSRTQWIYSITKLSNRWNSNVWPSFLYIVKLLFFTTWNSQVSLFFLSIFIIVKHSTWFDFVAALVNMMVVGKYNVFYGKCMYSVHVSLCESIFVFIALWSEFPLSQVDRISFIYFHFIHSTKANSLTFKIYELSLSLSLNHSDLHFDSLERKKIQH